METLSKLKVDKCQVKNFKNRNWKPKCKGYDGHAFRSKKELISDVLSCFQDRKFCSGWSTEVTWFVKKPIVFQKIERNFREQPGKTLTNKENILTWLSPNGTSIDVNGMESQSTDLLMFQERNGRVDVMGIIPYDMAPYNAISLHFIIDRTEQFRESIE